MRKRAVLWIAVLVLALISLLINMVHVTIADDEIKPQTATPLPSPTNNGGGATWDVKNFKFQSHYPDGMDFTVEASSSGGKITGATVFWAHSPAYVKRAQGEIDDSGTIKAVWDTRRGSDATPPWMAVDYWWVLTDEAGNVYQSPHNFAEYEDVNPNRSWHRKESDDIIVIWEDGIPDEIGQLTVDAMAEQRPFYYKNWGKLLNYKPRAIIFGNRQDYAEWSPGLDTVAGGFITAGQTNGEWGATVQIFLSSAKETAYVIVLHEVGHLYQSFSGAVTGLDWFIEGDASYFEKRDSASCVEVSKDYASFNDFPSLQGSGPEIRSGQRIGYDIGCAFFYWLAETFGEDAHLKLWSLIGKGVSRRDALQQVTGMNFVDMDTAFRKWIGLENPVAPTPRELPTLKFPPTRAPKKTKTPSNP